MGIFSKFLKSKKDNIEKKDNIDTRWDCSDRPIEWYLSEEQREVYNHYVTQDNIRSFFQCFSHIQRTSTQYVSRIFKCRILNEYKIDGILEPYLNPLYYFDRLLRNYSAELFPCQFHIDAHDQIQYTHYTDAVDFITAFSLEILLSLVDEDGDYEPIAYPNILLVDKNPILNYLTKMPNFIVDIDTKDFSGVNSNSYGYRSLLETYKNILKISFLLLAYFYETYFQNGINESNMDWIYDKSLYLIKGNITGFDRYPQARSFRDVSLLIKEKVAVPDLWDDLTERLNSCVEYIDSLCKII